LETQRTVEASARYAIAALTIADGHECQHRFTFPFAINASRTIGQFKSRPKETSDCKGKIALGAPPD
jgi:hypothetical protein